RKRSTGSGDHSSSEWKYKTGMYCASRLERCAGVTPLSRGDAGSAAAAHATAANPSATSIPRHLVRDLDIDASVAGRALAPAECGRLRTYDCLSSFPRSVGAKTAGSAVRARPGTRRFVAAPRRRLG